MTSRYLGMGLNQTANMLAQGIGEESALPKPISNLTPVYRPKIERDFPELGFANMENMAKNGLVSILNAVEAETAEGIGDASPRLVRQVGGIIDDNRSRGEHARYDDIRIHKISVSGYTRSERAAKADFEMSFEALCFTEKGGLVSGGSKEKPSQLAARITLTYNQEAHSETTSVVFGSSCPNCGAPVTAIGKEKHCPYCGSGLREISDRIWQIDSFSLLN